MDVFLRGRGHFYQYYSPKTINGGDFAIFPSILPVFSPNHDIAVLQKQTYMRTTDGCPLHYLKYVRLGHHHVGQVV